MTDNKQTAINTKSLRNSTMKDMSRTGQRPVFLDLFYSQRESTRSLTGNNIKAETNCVNNSNLSTLPCLPDFSGSLVTYSNSDSITFDKKEVEDGRVFLTKLSFNDNRKFNPDEDWTIRRLKTQSSENQITKGSVIKNFQTIGGSVYLNVLQLLQSTYEPTLEEAKSDSRKIRGYIRSVCKKGCARFLDVQPTDCIRLSAYTSLLYRTSGATMTRIQVVKLLEGVTFICLRKFRETPIIPSRYLFSNDYVVFNRSDTEVVLLSSSSLDEFTRLIGAANKPLLRLADEWCETGKRKVNSLRLQRLIDSVRETYKPEAWFSPIIVRVEHSVKMPPELTALFEAISSTKKAGIDFTVMLKLVTLVIHMSDPGMSMMSKMATLAVAITELPTFIVDRVKSAFSGFLSKYTPEADDGVDTGDWISALLDAPKQLIELVVAGFMSGLTSALVPFQLLQSCSRMVMQATIKEGVKTLAAAVVKYFLELVSRLWDCWKTKSWQPLGLKWTTDDWEVCAKAVAWYPTQLLKDVAPLQSQKQRAALVSKKLIPPHLEAGLVINDAIIYCNDLISCGRSIYALSPSPYCRQILDGLERALQIFRKQAVGPVTREVPTGIIMTGGAGIGKSVFARMLSDAINRAEGRVPELNFHAWSASSNFQDLYNNQNCVLFDDLELCIQQVALQTGALMMDMMTNAPLTIEAADIDKKGTLMFSSGVVIRTSNFCDDCGISKLGLSRPVHHRRFPVLLEISANPIYCYPGSLTLDGSKVTAGATDTQFIKIRLFSGQKVDLTDGSLDDFYTKGVTLSTKDALRYLVSYHLASKKLAEENAAKAATENLLEPILVDGENIAEIHTKIMECLRPTPVVTPPSARSVEVHSYVSQMDSIGAAPQGQSEVEEKEDIPDPAPTTPAVPVVASNRRQGFGVGHWIDGTPGKTQQVHNPETYVAPAPAVAIVQVRVEPPAEPNALDVAARRVGLDQRMLPIAAHHVDRAVQFPYSFWNEPLITGVSADFHPQVSGESYELRAIEEVIHASPRAVTERALIDERQRLNVQRDNGLVNDEFLAGEPGAFWITSRLFAVHSVMLSMAYLVLCSSYVLMTAYFYDNSVIERASSDIPLGDAIRMNMNNAMRLTSFSLYGMWNGQPLYSYALYVNSISYARISRHYGPLGRVYCSSLFFLILVAWPGRSSFKFLRYSYRLGKYWIFGERHPGDPDFGHTFGANGPMLSKTASLLTNPLFEGTVCTLLAALMAYKIYTLARGDDKASGPEKGKKNFSPEQLIVDHERNPPQLDVNKWKAPDSGDVLTHAHPFKGATWVEEELVKSIASSLFRVATETAKLYGLNIGSGVLLTVSHAFRDLIESRIDQLHVVVCRIGGKDQECRITRDVCRLVPGAPALCILELGLSAGGLRVFEQFLTSTNLLTVGRLDKAKAVRVLEGVVQVVDGGQSRILEPQTYGKGPSPDVITTPHYGFFGLSSAAGYCGLPVIGVVNGVCKIVGLHVGAVDAGLERACITVPVTTAALRNCLQTLKLPVQVTMESTFVKESDKVLPLKVNMVSQRCEIVCGNPRATPTIIGSASWINGRSEGKSKCTVSPLEPLLRDLEKEVCGGKRFIVPVTKGRMIGDVYVSPMTNSLATYNDVILDPDLTAVAAYLYCLMPENVVQFKECTLLEAMNGTLNVTKVDLSTSIGPPDAGDKRKYVEGPPGQRMPLGMFDEIRQEALAHMRNGQTFDIRVNCVPKDEPKLSLDEIGPDERYDAVHKPLRIFTIVSAGVNVAAKQVSQPLVEGMRYYRSHCESFVGVDMTSARCCAVSEHLEMVNPELNRITAGDVKSMDKSFSPGLFKALAVVAGFLTKLFGGNGTAVYTYFMSLSQCTLVHHTDLFKAPFNPSGHHLTVEGNGIVVSLCFRMVFMAMAVKSGIIPVAEFKELAVRANKWYRAAPLIGFTERPPVTQRDYFREKVRLATYGDDNVAATTSDYSFPKDFYENFQPITGLVMTAEDKASDVVQKRLDEALFLQRSIKFNSEVGCIMAALHKKSIVKMLMILKPSKESRISHLGQIATTALREAALHGREFYEMLYKLIVPFLLSNGYAGPQLVLNSYDELLGEMLRKTFSTYDPMLQSMKYDDPLCGDFDPESRETFIDRGGDDLAFKQSLAKRPESNLSAADKTQSNKMTTFYDSNPSNDEGLILPTTPLFTLSSYVQEMDAGSSATQETQTDYSYQQLDTVVPIDTIPTPAPGKSRSNLPVQSWDDIISTPLELVRFPISELDAPSALLGTWGLASSWAGNSRVKSLLDNYQFGRFTLVATVRVLTPPFSGGSYGLSFYTNTLGERQSAPVAANAASCDQHIFLFPASPGITEVEYPFFSELDFLTLSAIPAGYLKASLYCYSPLLSGQSMATVGSGCVCVSLHVKPGTLQLLNYLPESKPLKLAGEILDKGSQLASWLGFTRNPAWSAGNANINNHAPVGVVDATDSAVVAGIFGKARMSPTIYDDPSAPLLTTIAMQKAYHGQISWSRSATAGTSVKMRCAPGCRTQEGCPTDEVVVDGASYYAMPFKYWQGTMHFTLVSGFPSTVKGRFAAVWNTTHSGGATPATLNQFEHFIFEVAPSQQVTIVVGWKENTPFKRLVQTDTIFQIIPSASDPSGASNGWLQIMLLDPLAVSSPAGVDPTYGFGVWTHFTNFQVSCPVPEVEVHGTLSTEFINFSTQVYHPESEAVPQDSQKSSSIMYAFMCDPSPRSLVTTGGVEFLSARALVQRDGLFQAGYTLICNAGGGVTSGFYESQINMLGRPVTLLDPYWMTYAAWYQVLFYGIRGSERISTPGNTSEVMIARVPWGWRVNFAAADYIFRGISSMATYCSYLIPNYSENAFERPFGERRYDRVLFVSWVAPSEAPCNIKVILTHAFGPDVSFTKLRWLPRFSLKEGSAQPYWYRTG